MASKDFTLDDGLSVTVYKRRGNRYLRLSVTPTGRVRVSIPAWGSYRAGLEFVRSRRTWIQDQMAAPTLLRHGQAVGKAHHLNFVPKVSATSVNSRLAQTIITVNHPADRDFTDHKVQTTARQACIRALRRQAEQLLPQRLADLADKHGFAYQGVRIKHLKSRWGSCDQEGNIVLNLYLMQLPWELIDYVLLHELTHTRILRHGPDFWKAMDTVLPDTSARKRSLRNHRPALTVADIAV